ITPRQLAVFLNKIEETQLKTRNSAEPEKAETASQTPSEKPSQISDKTDAASFKIPEKMHAALSFDPVSENTIPADFYKNITISAPIPNTFYLDEVYFIEGSFSGTTAEDVFVFLCRDGESCNESIDFVGAASDGGSKFRIPVNFTEAGNFQLGMIPGRSGQSKITKISVLPATGPLETSAAPTNLAAVYKQGKTEFSWNGKGKFTRLTIFQKERRKDYLFRQGIQSFSPPSKDFEEFKKGPAGWLVAHDATQSGVQNISLTTQDFRKVDDAEIDVKTMQEFFPDPPRFIFEAKAKKPISKRGAVTLPNGDVQDFSLGENDLPTGSEIRVEKDFREIGTYIFEINNPQGSAVVNVPVYVGPSLPLLPDYFALETATLDKKAITDSDKFRREFLTFINMDRENTGLKKVSVSSELNAIAQAHSENMVETPFFGHVNPEGKSPDDRRKDAKYPAAIRENLAKAADIEGAEKGLMRSPIHRATILDPHMTRVGLGIAKNDEGYLIVTQNFSGEPLSEADVPRVQTELFSAASVKRASLGLPPLAENQLLKDIATQWAKKMNIENLFDIQDSSGNSIIKSARDSGVRTSIQVHIVKASQQDQLEEEILNQKGLQDDMNRNIGIGVSVSETGELYMAAMYTP
ncbi:hypothetical protein HYV58_01710, partial [Candidatus Peregrinibacteria bacterium]|nr:hypothetical protein [Candidatus Peregrinibacteria bacterium]